MEWLGHRCQQCGFDGRDWDDRDAVNTVAALGPMVTHAVERLEAGVVVTRMDRRTWSIGMYLAHLLAIANRAGELIEAGIENTSPPPSKRDRRAARPPALTINDLPTVVDAINELTERLHRQLVGLGAVGLAPISVADRSVRTMRGAVEGLLHEFIHHLGDVSRIQHELGGMIKLSGRLSGINSSRGGVPKRPMATARIDRDGVVGDAQGKRAHHGRPWQALCLYSVDVIDRLRADGHPIEPGAVGENLTVSSVDWSMLRPGLTVKVGEVWAVLTLPAQPCGSIRGSFSDGDSTRIDHRLHPGWARWYASVSSPGVVAVGDEVIFSSYRAW